MPVKAPSKRLGKSVKLEFVVKMLKGHGRANVVSDLNVTPMVDMLVMLVIFLLMTFSASGEILFISKDIVLPDAYNAADMDRAPVIAISNSSISFEGELIANTANVNSDTFKAGMIPVLKEKLDETREKWKASRPDTTFDGQIIIQSHNEVPFSVLKIIMKTCSEAEYMGMNFAIKKVGRSSGNAEG